jgi:hypothetical protein
MCSKRVLVSLVGKATELLTAEQSVFDSRQRLDIIIFSASSMPVLWPTKSPIQRTLSALLLWLKGQGREAVYSHPASIKVKNCGA